MKPDLGMPHWAICLPLLEDGPKSASYLKTKIIEAGIMPADSFFVNLRRAGLIDCTSRGPRSLWTGTTQGFDRLDNLRELITPKETQ